MGKWVWLTQALYKPIYNYRDDRIWEYILTILHPIIELFLEIKIYEWPKFGV